jgi:uncharacterized protein (TIRG00374 family)
LTLAHGSGGGRRRIPGWFFPFLGYAISVACLVWVYHGFDWRGQLPRLAHTDLRWVTLAILGDIAVYVCQGIRWKWLLKPLGEVPAWKCVQAVYIGLFANEVLPLRSGEVIRCYLMRRWSGLPLTVVFSSAIIERVMDGVWLITGFYMVGLFVELPRLLTEASKVLMVILAVLTGLLTLAVWYRKRAHEMVSGSRWSAALRHMVDGVHAMGNRHTFLVAAALSGVYLALQLIPVWALMRGFGLDLSPLAAGAVLVILRLGTVVPTTPGNVGSFQALVVLGMQALGQDRATATGYATLLFFVITAPLWLAGFVALLATRMRLTDLRRDAEVDAGSVS